MLRFSSPNKPLEVLITILATFQISLNWRAFRDFHIECRGIPESNQLVSERARRWLPGVAVEHAEHAIKLTFHTS